MVISNRSRINKARRLYRRAPLFAFQELQAHLGECYSYDQFLDDLRLRSKPKPRVRKSGLIRYGRYRRMMEFVSKWRSSGDINSLIEAQKLRDRISKPYRLQVRYGQVVKEYHYPPEVPIFHLEEIIRLSYECRAHTEFESRKEEKEKYGVY